MEIMHSSSKEIESSSDSKKCCSICKTTKTPLWRSGPTGPKSLCNACGIKYRKRRGKDVKPLKGHGRKKQKSSSAVSAEAEAEAEAEVGDSKAKEGKMGKEEGGKLLKVRLAPLGKEVVPLQRQRSPVSRRRKLGEVERAAALLMALSCGSVFG